jgi:hypothetical protein
MNPKAYIPAGAAGTRNLRLVALLATIGLAPAADPLPALSGWRRART